MTPGSLLSSPVVLPGRPPARPVSAACLSGPGLRAASPGEVTGRIFDVRLPDVPGARTNADLCSLGRIADLVEGFGRPDAEVNVTVASRPPEGRYEALHRPFRMAGCEPVSQGVLASAVAAFESRGVRCLVGKVTPF